MADVIFPGTTGTTKIGTELLPSSVDLVLWQGDYFDLTVTVTDELDNPIDITGQTAHAAIRANYDDTTTHDFTTEIVNAAGGVVRLYLPSEVTSGITAGDYIWDFQLRKANGDTRTYMAGDVLVYREVNA